MECFYCKGRGLIDIRCTCIGMSPQYQCKKCDNTGIAETVLCGACDGTGKEADSEETSFGSEIPSIRAKKA